MATFIELIELNVGRPILINLDRVTEIRRLGDSHVRFFQGDGYSDVVSDYAAVRALLKSLGLIVVTQTETVKPL